MMVVALLPVAAAAQSQVPGAAASVDFGHCASRQAPAAARTLLATEVGSWEEYRQAGQLLEAAAGCDRREIGTSVADVRGVVAEAMLPADVRTRLAARPPVPVVRVDAALDGRAFVATYAACLVNAEPAKSVALLATARRSQSERDGFAAYGGALADCMPEGVTRRIDRADVRNHIAAYLYRTALAAEGAH